MERSLDVDVPYDVDSFFILTLLFLTFPLFHRLYVFHRNSFFRIQFLTTIRTHWVVGYLSEWVLTCSYGHKVRMWFSYKYFPIFQSNWVRSLSCGFMSSDERHRIFGLIYSPVKLYDKFRGEVYRIVHVTNWKKVHYDSYHFFSRWFAY